MGFGTAKMVAMYSGADWIEKSLKINNMSDLGRDVADLLGYLLKGIYHDEKAIRKVDWSNKHYIEYKTYGGHGNWASFDFDYLTQLVFLAHHMAIRVEITPVNFTHIRILFHRRSRNGDIYQRHPTLDEAVARFKETCYLEEKL